MRNVLLAVFTAISVTAISQTSITCDSILQTSTCAGGNVIIAFQTTGTFPWGNNFTAELSDNWGGWGNPIAIGSTPFVLNGNGIIFATIPANANFGFLYRVRIISSNPADTSNNSPNTLIVTQIAMLNTIVSNPGDSACPGDTITLYALNPASEYQWSTGDTTASIQVTTSGIYSVTTTDALTCQSTANDTIVFDPSLCTGIAENENASLLHVYPNPATENVRIEFDGAINNASLDVTDITGRVVLQQALTNDLIDINISGFAPGVYFISVYSGSQKSVRRVIVQ